MDLSQLVTLFWLLGLMFLATVHLVSATRLAVGIASVVCFLVAVILHLVIVTS